ncbi:MAG TPA: hypothetical protein VK658_06965 [Chryseolinea sp.]|nr:hypothetical protein [Chryseolinea sp.]
MHGFHALVAVDLPEITEQQNRQFCEVLEGNNWTMVSKRSMIWRVSFRLHVRRMGAIRTIQSSLHEAKKGCGVKYVEYAVQMDVKEVVVAKA